MAKRKPIPKEVQDELLFQSGRRCCLCYGLKHDLSVKPYGQIAHLNRNPDDNTLDNLVYLCVDHYSQVDGREGQSPVYTLGEIKRYRRGLYAEIEAVRRRGAWPTGVEVLYLSIVHPLEPVPGLAGRGIQLVDADQQLYLSLYFRTSLYHGMGLPQNAGKWLYIEAHMRPALMLRVPVRAWNDHEADGLVHFLRAGGAGQDLHGERLNNDDLSTGDYLYLWQEDGEFRLILSVFAPSQAGIALQARLTAEAAGALADYLEEVGFVEHAQPIG